MRQKQGMKATKKPPPPENDAGKGKVKRQKKTAAVKAPVLTPTKTKSNGTEQPAAGAACLSSASLGSAPLPEQSNAVGSHVAGTARAATSPGGGATAGSATVVALEKNRGALLVANTDEDDESRLRNALQHGANYVAHKSPVRETGPKHNNSSSQASTNTKPRTPSSQATARAAKAPGRTDAGGPINGGEGGGGGVGGETSPQGVDGLGEHAPMPSSAATSGRNRIIPESNSAEDVHKVKQEQHQPQQGPSIPVAMAAVGSLKEQARGFGVSYDHCGRKRWAENLPHVQTKGGHVVVLRVAKSRCKSAGVF